MELAIKIWNQHIEVFKSFDLVCHNGCSLEDETKSVSLFHALITLEEMKNKETGILKYHDIINAIQYLKTSRYYSEGNKDSKH